MNTEFGPELQGKLELLEQRIGALLLLVKELRQENARLKCEISGVQEKLAATESDADRLHTTLAEAERWKTEVHALRTSRDQAIGKIERLLIQLDDLQTEVTAR